MTTIGSGWTGSRQKGRIQHIILWVCNVEIYANKLFLLIQQTPLYMVVKESIKMTRISGRFSNRNHTTVDDMDMWGGGAGYGGGGNHVDMWGGQGGGAAGGDFWEPGPVRQGRISGFFPLRTKFHELMFSY